MIGDLVKRGDEYGIVTGENTVFFGNGLNEVLSPDDQRAIQPTGASFFEMTQAWLTLHFNGGKLRWKDVPHPEEAY